MKKISNSPEETLQLGKSFGCSLEAGDIVLLFGDLGAGKTHFTQGICYGLELDKDFYIRSPTFTLINEYPGRLPIYHIDLYRIDNQEEIYSLGLEELLFNQGRIVLSCSVLFKFIYLSYMKYKFVVSGAAVTDHCSPDAHKKTEEIGREIVRHGGILITGANAGLGKECARQLALQDGIEKIYLGCRNEAKAKIAKLDLERSTGKSIFEIVIINVADLDSILIGYRAGNSIEVEFFRGDTSRRVTVTLDERPR